MALLYRPTTEYAVSVCIGTFGDPVWEDRAKDAAESAIAQRCAEVVHVHGDTLADARNRAVEEATGEWIVTLDADDALAPGYVDAMAHATGDLRAPTLELAYHDRRVRPDLTKRDIERMNPCCIGTAIRRDLLLDVGGFPDFEAWEDWAVFLRAVRRGATIEHVPAAVYRSGVRAHSRNQVIDDPRALFNQIRAWA